MIRKWHCNIIFIIRFQAEKRWTINFSSQSWDSPAKHSKRFDFPKTPLPWILKVMASALWTMQPFAIQDRYQPKHSHSMEHKTYNLYGLEFDVRGMLIPILMNLNSERVWKQRFDFEKDYNDTSCAGCPKLGPCRTAGDMGNFKIQWQLIGNWNQNLQETTLYILVWYSYTS